MRTTLFVSLFALGCASLPKPLLRDAPAVDALALQRAADSFFQAKTTEQLRQALAAAHQAGPDSALYHSLAAELADLEARDDDAYEHRFQALQRRDNDAALLQLHDFWKTPTTLEQRRRTWGLLQALSTSHPDEAVRAAAAFYCAQIAQANGAFTQRDETLALIPGSLRFSLAGTWDNEQGKGFEQELDPESRSGLNEVYQGRLGPVSWRPSPPLNPYGELDLSNALSPNRWVVAFAQADYDAAADGDYVLRVTSTDPVKIWVDGKLVFAAAHLERSVFDHVQIPLKLRKGRHLVLLKSAQRDDDWLLSARLVPTSQTLPPVKDVEGLVAARVASLPPGPRKLYYQALWTHHVAGGNHAVKAAEAFARASPSSLYARLMVVQALWFNQERGRTADVLAQLDHDVGAELPFVRLWQVLFWSQQGLKNKARTALTELHAAKPALREALEQLADTYENEGWLEDELSAREELLQKFPLKQSNLTEYASLLVRLGRRAEAVKAQARLLDEVPYHGDGLAWAADMAVGMGDFSRAESLYLKKLKAAPNDVRTRFSLADVYRRQRKREQAQAQLEAVLEINPRSAGAYLQLGNLAYEAGDRRAGIEKWQKSLDLNPDDERLANRLDFVAPAAKGPWAADIPDDAVIEQTLRLRKQPLPKTSAETAYLLDHEVILLNNDGSTTRVVTQIQHALNAAGRDRMTRQSVQGNGRFRMLNSYAVDPSGNRTEASSERGRQVFFRNLQVGSTTVLQYRLDASPTGYLARYFTEDWSFQGVNDFRVKSQLALWLPMNTKLHEERTGNLERLTSTHGDQMRVEWTGQNMPPLSPEPAMPTVRELVANIRLSTVPDWNTWLSWEKSLLEGAFRDSPEVEALATQLGADAPTVDAKLKRIHQYLMEEIRYQQDYESFIAGVKPHPAPMVLERKYGDCKDKAVLFITLAKRMGIDAHFALVRTRDVGPVNQDVPMQQFNHAIVYVPEQKGYPGGRFFDPTAELLDLDVVRNDDTGTRSLVYDPANGTHTWREIPFQTPEFNADETSVSLKLNPDGNASGQLVLKSQGKNGSFFRRLARNPDLLSQTLQRVAGALLPGAVTREATAWEVKDLTVPAVLTADTEAKASARKEGDTLRLRIPTDYSPRTTFALATRKLPLVLGAPAQMKLNYEVTLPDGFQTKSLPTSTEVKSKCLSFSRQVSVSGQVFKMEQRVRTLCERITPEEYPRYREQADAINRLLEEELVLAPSKAKSPPRSR